MKIFVSFKTFFLVRYIYIRSIDERFPTKYRSLRGDGVFTVPCHELFNRYANFKEYVLKRVYRILDSLPRVMRTEHFSQQLLIIREINRISIVRVFPSPRTSEGKFCIEDISSPPIDTLFILISSSVHKTFKRTHKFIYNFEHDSETIPINFSRHL